MDCAIIPLQRFKDVYMIQTVDFFYPLIDDPELMGQIALANVLSDVFAVGVTDIDSLEMLISSPIEFTDKERDVICPLIIKGFKKLAEHAGCRLRIQNAILNPWCIIGGIATSICKLQNIITPINAQIGDAIILTKPLGTQIATNAYIWMEEKNEKYTKLREFGLSDDDIRLTFQKSVKSMTYLNKNAALLMHKYNAHAATDVTGFGLLGHANNLSKFQISSVAFSINKLPILKNVLKMADIVGMSTKIKAGRSVETSGGLFICLSAENAKLFCEEFHLLTEKQHFAWIIGNVIDSKVREATLEENIDYIEVEL